MDLVKDVSRRFTRKQRRRQMALLASTAGLGAGLMYLLDPDRGKRRRALVRDKGAHAARRAGVLLDRGARDFTYRLRGLAAEARWITKQDHPSDALLVERVRSRLGRAVSHPHAIRVEAQDGRISLHGPVLREEVGHLLAEALSTHGVKAVDDHLEPHDASEGVPALQGSNRRGGERFGFMQERWSPVTRLAMGVVGGGLVAYGLARRGPVGLVAGGAGAALLVRNATNRPLARLVGIGAGRRAVDFHKTIHVHAPIEDVYAFFTHVENFPRFMSHLRDVEKIGEDRYRWIAEGPAHVPVAWDAEVTQRVPNEVFAWKSVDGSAIANAGVVRFEPEGDRCTRLDIQMSYNPPAGAVGHVVASIFGADPKHAMDQDLVRFQSLLERGKTTAHHRQITAEDLGMKR
jgi:uncharacterized membrane protein/uncharacterized protein YwbE